MSGFDVYKVRDGEALDAEFFDRRFRDVDSRFSALERLKIAWEEALRVVSDRVLSRSEDVIFGLRDQLVSITQLEWLTAQSGTSHTLANDAVLSFDIVESDRALFAPGPYAMLSRTTDPATWAIVRTLGYDRETGQWDVRVESFAGAAGPFVDWEIAAVAGSTLAQKAYLAQGADIHDATDAIRADAIAQTNAIKAATAIIRDDAQAAKTAAETARDTTNQHKLDAQAAKTAAETARDAAQGYRDTTLTHRNAAEGFKNDAAGYAAAAAAAAASVDGAGLDARLDVLEAWEAATQPRLTRIEVDAWFFSR